MDKIKHLCRVEFDQVMKSKKDLLLFFYKNNDATSILGLNTMQEVFTLIARPFDMYLIDVEKEPEIANAFSIEIVPEYISMKENKIYKRSTDLLEASGALSLLK